MSDKLLIELDMNLQGLANQVETLAGVINEFIASDKKEDSQLAEISKLVNDIKIPEVDLSGLQRGLDKIGAQNELMLALLKADNDDALQAGIKMIISQNQETLLSLQKLIELQAKKREWDFVPQRDSMTNLITKYIAKQTN